MADISELLDAALEEDFATDVAQPNTPESVNNAETVETTQATDETVLPVSDTPTDGEKADSIPEATIESAPDYLEGVAPEDWKAVPPSVRTAMGNMVGQVRAYVEENAPRLEAFNALTLVLQPHMETIRASGHSPLAVVDGTLRLAQNLWTGQPQTKADTIAGLIQDYGVDIAMLEQALLKRIELAKNPVHSEINRQLAPIQQQLQQVLQFTQDQRQAPARQAQTEQLATINKEVADFATAKNTDGTAKHPHYQTVRIDMGDIFTLAAKRGETITLEEAYKRACASRGLQPAPETKKPIGLSVKGSSTTAAATPTKRLGSVGAALDAAFDLHTTH